MSGERAKALGAFYTSDQIAEFLVWWSVRDAGDVVLDPSFGGGVFLRAACRRLREVGGKPKDQVIGVEIDEDAFAATSESLARDFGIAQANLHRADFFAVDRRAIPEVDAVVGNPPFIRYQRFSGEARKRALRRAASQGVRLSELSSSWAPFLIHAIAMLKRGGRLAMVVPSEVAHATYARPVLDHLRRSFGEVSFVTFRRKLFPDLSEETLLLLARDRGVSCSRFLWRDLDHASGLAEIHRLGEWPLSGMDPLDTEALSRGSERLIEYFIPRAARELYRRLKESALVARLGAVADVGIGYVTGANDFFHLSPVEARSWDIPEQFLRRAVRRGRSLSGLRFTAEDWHVAAGRGGTGYLLAIPLGAEIPIGLRRYLARGEALGVPRGYKCRSRSPWYRVPHVHQPDAFLSYMSGAFPRLVVNHAGAVAPNSLHIVRLHPLAPLESDNLPALWQTSLTRLSVEIEGHALGGGMLKVEPTEAENVLVPIPDSPSDRIADSAHEWDALARSGRDDEVRALADRAILRDRLGLSETECRSLHAAADALRDRRYSRSASA